MKFATTSALNPQRFSAFEQLLVVRNHVVRKVARELKLISVTEELYRSLAL